MDYNRFVVFRWHMITPLKSYCDGIHKEKVVNWVFKEINAALLKKAVHVWEFLAILFQVLCKVTNMGGR